MLKINRRTDYAVRVGIALAKRPPGTRVSTQVIQGEMQIPRAFLQRIISELSQANLIHTYAGPAGGIQLARPAQEISLLDIHQAMEEPLCLSDCLISPNECPLNNNCPVRQRWGRLQAVMRNELSHTSLWQLVQEAMGVNGHSQPIPVFELTGLEKVPEFENQHH